MWNEAQLFFFFSVLKDMDLLSERTKMHFRPTQVYAMYFVYNEWVKVMVWQLQRKMKIKKNILNFFFFFFFLAVC